MLKRALKSLVAVVLIVSFMTTTAAFYYFWVAATPIFNPPRMVSVKKGDSIRAITEKLQAAGVVRNAVVARVYAGLSGAAPRLQPGDYAFKGGERVPDVIGHLANGDFIVVTVTVPEGLTVYQIAGKIEQAGLGCAIDFTRAARDGPLVTALGLTPLGAEGYLFPATYYFPPSARINTILGTMLERFYAVLTPRVEERMFKIGMTQRELVTIASIIEKEAKLATERPLIAGVLYNRLRLNMPLQSDPTAQYSYDGSIDSALRAVHSPSAFNTYDFVGLPPGPIANPGLASIMAALYPAQTDFLYFVARDDGSHIFSRSLESHNRAIASLRKRSVNPARGAATMLARPAKQDNVASGRSN
jgi:UPF0755 protein